jgi:hypothetical protein
MQFKSKIFKKKIIKGQLLHFAQSLQKLGDAPEIV